MKFLITENQLDKAALLWMNKNFSPDQLEIVTSEKYPDSIFYRKNGKVVMKQDKKNKNFWFDYDEIYSFFKSFFSMEYEEWQRIMKIWLEETFKLEGYTPRGQARSLNTSVGGDFQIRGIYTHDNPDKNYG